MQGFHELDLKASGQAAWFGMVWRRFCYCIKNDYCMMLYDAIQNVLTWFYNALQFRMFDWGDLGSPTCGRILLRSWPNSQTWRPVAFLLEVDAETTGVLDLLEVSLEAWIRLERKTIESSWMVTGYFDPSHFEPFRAIDGQEGVSTMEEAVHEVDPAQVLEGSKLVQTPQFCTKFEWQVEDTGVDKLKPYCIFMFFNHGISCCLFFLRITNPVLDYVDYA